MGNWQPADIEDTLAGRDEMQSGVPFLKVESGGKKFRKTWLRILPPRKDAPKPRYFYGVPTHFNIGGRTVICPRFSSGEDLVVCPVCTAARAAYAEGDKERGRDLSAKWVGLMNVVRLNEDGEPDGGVIVWSCPKGTLDEMLNLISDPDDGEPLPADEQDVSHPETGRDMWIKRKGTTQFDTRYKVGYAEEPSELSDPSVLDGMHDLTTVYATVSASQIAGLLEGGDPWQEEAEEPSPGEDDEDVVEGDYREVDEDEEEPPKKPTRGRPKGSKNGEGKGSAAKARLGKLLEDKKRSKGEDEDDDDE